MRHHFTSMILCAVAMTFAATSLGAQPAPDSEASRVLRFTADLEQQPLGDEAVQRRQWLIHWVHETKDYSVTVCEILGPVPSESPPNSAELMAQQIFVNVSFQIRSPGTKDQLSLQLAGVESALRAYSVLLAASPKNRIPYFDGLLKKRASGSLKEHMAPIVAKACRNA